MSTDTWNNWISFGGAVVFAAIGLLIFYGPKSQQRQAKFIVYIGLCILQFTVSPALALNQTFFARNDGIIVQWGRYAIFAIGHPFIAVFTALLFSTNRKYCAIAFGLGLWASISNLLMALTPSVNGGDDFNTLIVWTVFSFVPLVLLMVMFGVTAVGWLGWMFEDDETDQLSLNTNSLDGSRVLSHPLTLIAIGILNPLLLAAYPILTCVGPDGYRVYTSFSEQSFLYICLADGLIIIALTLELIFINDDSVYALFPFRLFAKNTQLDVPPATLNEPGYPVTPASVAGGSAYAPQVAYGYAPPATQPSGAVLTHRTNLVQMQPMGASVAPSGQQQQQATARLVL